MTAEQITGYGVAVLGLLSTFIGLVSGAVYLWLKRRENIRQTAAINAKAEEVNRHEREVNLQAEDQARVQAEQAERKAEQDRREREFEYITQHLKDTLMTAQKEMLEADKRNAAKIEKILDEHQECRESLADIRVRHETQKERADEAEAKLAAMGAEVKEVSRSCVQLESRCQLLEAKLAMLQEAEGGAK